MTAARSFQLKLELILQDWMKPVEMNHTWFKVTSIAVKADFIVDYRTLPGASVLTIHVCLISCGKSQR